MNRIGSPAIVEALSKYIPQGYPTQRTLAFTTEDLQSLDVVIEKIEKFSPQSHAVIVLAGGRDLRKLCSIALQVTQNLRLRGVVVAPSTFGDAIEAVLAHSVTASIGSEDPASDAVTVRTIFSPDAFVIPLDSLDRMGSQDRKDALVRCLRLGLLFDQPLYRVVREGMSHSHVETAFALDVLRHSVSVVNEMADLNPQSLGIARVAQFGDAHAAMIEQITSGKVHGGGALLLGMMLEATLSHSTEIARELRQIADYLGATFPSELRDHANWAKISAFYDATLTILIDGERHLTNLAVREVGQFSVQAFRERLPPSAGRLSKSLAKFANVQAEGALQQCTLHKLQIAIVELSIVFAESSNAYPAVQAFVPSSH